MSQSYFCLAALADTLLRVRRATGDGERDLDLDLPRPAGEAEGERARDAFVFGFAFAIVTFLPDEKNDSASPWDPGHHWNGATLAAVSALVDAGQLLS